MFASAAVRALVLDTVVEQGPGGVGAGNGVGTGVGLGDGEPTGTGDVDGLVPGVAVEGADAVACGRCTWSVLSLRDTRPDLSRTVSHRYTRRGAFLNVNDVFRPVPRRRVGASSGAFASRSSFQVYDLQLRRDQRPCP